MTDSLILFERRTRELLFTGDTSDAPTALAWRDQRYGEILGQLGQG